MIGLPYDKMQAHQANIQIVGANCSKPLPLFGNICWSVMFCVIALCVVGSHCGVYRKRICPPALPALDTIVSNFTYIWDVFWYLFESYKNKNHYIYLPSSSNCTEHNCLQLDLYLRCFFEKHLFESYENPNNCIYLPPSLPALDTIVSN